MGVLVAILVVTNVATVAVLAWVWHRRGSAVNADQDPRLTSALAAGMSGRERRVITIEVLNPLELAGSRGRVAAVAGSLVPGLTRRLVHDQIVKVLRRQLVEQHVLADVRLHTLHPAVAPPSDEPATVPAPSAVFDGVSYVPYVDEVEVVDLTRRDQPPV